MDSAVMALLLVAFVAAVALLVRDCRSARLEARAAIEEKLAREGRFSPTITRSVPLQAARN